MGVLGSRTWLFMIGKTVSVQSDFRDFLEQAKDSVYGPLELGFTLSLPKFSIFFFA